MNAPDQKSRIPLFLRWGELMQLKEYPTDNRRMERVRDLFCFMCFAGLRFSELQRLQKEDLKEGGIVVRGQLGGVRVIPMNTYALQIRQKYENKHEEELIYTYKLSSEIIKNLNSNDIDSKRIEEFIDFVDLYEKSF